MQQAAKNPVPTMVTDIKQDDLVDLESCPYLKDHASAQYEYGRVSFVQRETDDCVVLGYEGIDHIGYPADTVLQVLPGSVTTLQ